MSIPDSRPVLIFDTTLRDGEQCPGATLNTPEKLEVAKQLARLGVDIIEAGFPYASTGDFEAVQRIAQEVQGPVICGLARALKGDIKRCAEAISAAPRRRIHTFLSTSDIHLEHQLRKSRAEVLVIAGEMVAYSRELCEDVEFSPMDAGRSDPEFLYTVIERAIANGATTINIPDTVGYTTPVEFGQLIAGIRANVANIAQAVLSVHCHNDLGLAVANSLEAVKQGARQVECTINGIGERAGNTSLEEVVMALQVRRNYFNPYFGREPGSETPLTQIKTQEIYRTSRLVSNLTGMLVHPNKAIVGANAFAHESGIHQDGLLKNKNTYEIMDAQSIGLLENTLVLGKHSGRNAFRSRLEELGYQLSDDDLNRAFLRFKDVADKKKTISDWDIEAMVNDELRVAPQAFVLERVQVSCGDGLPTATVQLRGPDGVELLDAAVGTGPVDAVYKAINRLVAVPNELIEFSVQSVTAGIDAMGEVTIRLRHNQQTYSGHSANTDIIVASAHAYIGALNKLYQTLKEASQPALNRQQAKEV
ncbi:2-isopropylmalate synthase [Candidatus Cyanaurora vandensis]|uniref:2-isopropylmalate synthase n=1 Tax=Candidatus Cyanaurora vandensis TaxID=2714958 RepID=UPI00257B2039|nr:2-isopropylmalate synthase [Candidatus Cyanaurora vandensis]